MSALAWTTLPDAAAAQNLVDAVLAERLAACANIVAPVQSHFLWNGAVDSAGEVGVLFKTEAGCLPALLERVAALHPYDCPAVLGWPVTAAPVTAAWLAEASGPGDVAP